MLTFNKHNKIASVTAPDRCTNHPANHSSKWNVVIKESNIVVKTNKQAHLPPRLLLDLAVLMTSEPNVVAFFIRSLNKSSLELIGTDKTSPKPFHVKAKTDSRRHSETRGYVPAPPSLSDEQIKWGISIVKLRRRKKKTCFLSINSPCFPSKKLRILAWNGLPITSDVDLLAIGTVKKENHRRYDNPYAVKVERPTQNKLPAEDPSYGNICSIMRSILLTQDMLVKLSLMNQLIMHNVESDNPYATGDIDFPVTLTTCRKKVGKMVGLIHLAYCQKAKQYIDMYVIRNARELQAAVVQLRHHFIQVRLHPSWRKKYACLRNPKLNGCYTPPRKKNNLQSQTIQTNQPMTYR